MSNNETNGSASEHRSSDRRISYAKVTAGGIPGYIRNLSEDGIGVEFLLPSGFVSGQEVVLQIHPEEITGLEGFSCNATVMWLKDEPPYFNVGFRSIKSVTGSSEGLKKLLAYYSH